MAGESISLDDLLARQERQGLPGVVDAVADRPDHVRITPYAVGHGPVRSHAFVVPKDTVESVVTTDESYACCGRKIPVVEIVFADPVVNDVLRQLSKAFSPDIFRRTPRVAPRVGGPAPRARRHRQVRSDPFYCESVYHDCAEYCISLYGYGTKEFYECESTCLTDYWHCLHS